MLKVVIVDDEMIVRIGFQSCIRWEDYGCQVAAACESAEDAIAFFQKEVPDIVFTDIMMPGMNGIELVKYIAKHYPRTKVVVLSCLNEIDYVKQAIKLGAEDYILKLSFTQETMAELIGKLRDTIEEERRQAGKDETYLEIQSFKREDGFRMLAEGSLTVFEREALLDKLGYPYDPFEVYYTGCFLIDHFKAVKGARDGDLHLMQYGLLNMIREYFGKLALFDLAFIREDEIMVLFRFRSGEDFPKNLEDIHKTLSSALKTHFNLTLSMGMNRKAAVRGAIPAHYRDARELALLRFFDGCGSYHQDEKLCSESFATRRGIQKKLQEAIFRQNLEETRGLTDSWFESMRGFQTFEQIKNIRRSVVETWVFISGYSLPEGPNVPDCNELYSTADFWEAETLEELKEAFLKGMLAIADYLQANRTENPEIVRLLRYLNDHVEMNISLEEAAGRCALGKSQFCLLFKKHTGETFVNYFNRLKMKRAFALLSSENIQVQEAANAIGVRDISYFSRMFKKYYGISPSDVKKR